MRLVNVPPGGQTVTLGNVSCVMGRTETEVEMGLSSHPRNRLLHFRSEIHIQKGSANQRPESRRIWTNESAAVCLEMI